MKLINNTDLQARLFTGALSEYVNGGWVVARRTYALPAGGGGELAPSADQWPVFSEPLKTQLGVFPADDYPFRSQAELVVVGSARPRRPVPHMELKLTVGAFASRIIVVGNRRWIKRGSDLVASGPEPFVEMDLGLKNAFGGITEYEGMAFPHPLNPEGKGFHLTAEQAVGTPLPNIERPDCLIRSWSDQPMVATWGPIAGSSQSWQMAQWIWRRTRDSKKPLEEEEIAKKARTLHQSAASPPMLLEEMRPGDPVQLDLGPEKIDFRVPALSAVVRDRVGNRLGRRVLGMSGIWVIVPKRLVVITWIARFKYSLRKGEDRTAVLGME